MNLRRPLLLALTLLPLALPARGLALDEALRPTAAMADEAKVVVQLLETVHYLNTPVSDETFHKLITQFMSDLDEQRLFFTAADEAGFLEKYGSAIGRGLKEHGDLGPAFHIFEVYRERADARIAWALERLDDDFDFAVDESYEFSRRDLPWPEDLERADDLWRRRIKFEIIPELLNGKTTDEARDIVRRRYERLRKNLAEIEAPEVQEIFLSTLTRLYDPHSTFFSAETYEDFAISMRLSLVGIGALLSSEDGYCVIKELLPGGPAMLSRQLKVNDKIVAVAQEGDEPVDVIGMNLRKVVKMIRGEKGTPIRLTIVPGDGADDSVRRELTLVRDVVRLNASRAKATIQELPSSDGTTVSIGVIDIPSFYGPVDDGEIEGMDPASVTADVEELLGKLKEAGVRGVVLDLRQNGGGLLGEAVSLTGLFIPKGPVVVVRDQFGHTLPKPDIDPHVAYAGPLMVLTSRYSASASEIVAGALQDYGRAIIVGDRSTHGKGTVQAVYEMDMFRTRNMLVSGHAGATKLTIQKFYLPSGASTQNKGVVPDISLPAIEDFLPIGESDLPNSLPWDEIRALSFKGQPLDPALKNHLKEGTEGRVSSLEEFGFLQKRIDWLRAREEMKAISLNLETRRQIKAEEESFREAMKTEQKTLAALNYATKDVVLDSVAETDEATASADDTPTPSATTALDETVPEDEDSATPDFDVHLREALRLLRDAIAIEPDPTEWTKSASMIAAVTRHGPSVIDDRAAAVQKN